MWQMPWPCPSKTIPLTWYFIQWWQNTWQTRLPACRNLCGLLMFHTVSFWSYASLIAAATPHWFHLFFVRHLGMGRIEEDVFPTHYRINTASAIRGIARELGVAAQVENIPVPPAYLAFSYPTWRLGVLFGLTFEKWFPWLRAQIVCRIHKPIASTAAGTDAADKTAA